MSVTGEALRKHPGLNPAYFDQMEKRRDAQRYNRQAKAANLITRATNAKAPMLAMIAVPKQPNKYLPHQGAKESGA